MIPGEVLAWRNPRRGALQEGALLGLLVVTLVAMAGLNADFFKLDNLLEMSRFFVETGLIALAMTAVIISGGIDLSVGAIVGLAVVAMGLGWKLWHVPPLVGVAVGLAVGAVGGFINGAFVAWVRVPPLIVTLATMALFRGVALGLGSTSAPVSDFTPSYYGLGQGYYTMLGGLQVPQQLPVFLVFLALAAVALHRTVLGRYVYAIGHNERAAWFAGVPVGRVKVILYVFSGIMCGLAGAIFLSRVATAKADAGTLMELDVITVCVLGGVSISGGRGSILGTVLGLLIVSSLVRGLMMARVPMEDQKIVLGVVLIMAAIVHQIGAAQARRRRSTPQPDAQGGGVL